MEFPEVKLGSDLTIDAATELVVAACEDLSEELYSLDFLNSLESISDSCRFLQTHLDDRDCVIVVMVAPWEEALLLRILNILLEIRAELAGAGRPLFRFVSTYAVPGVLGTLFGDGEVGEFESRAAPAVGFGVELRPESAMHLAAVGMFLLREAFGVKIDFWCADGDQRIAEVLGDFLDPAAFPEDAVPLNTLLALGFLYGERQRARLPWLSHWVALGDLGPWPSVILTNERESELADEEADVRRVAFSPIAMVVGAFRAGRPSLLGRAAEDLEDRCTHELGGQPLADGAAADEPAAED